MGQCGHHLGKRCNARNGKVGTWIEPGRFISAAACIRILSRNGYDHLKPGASFITIVLTVMHLDHQPENCAEENLLHGCQGCHNRYDAPHRRETRFWRRRRESGTDELFK